MTDYGISSQKLKNSAIGSALTRGYAALEPDPMVRNQDYLAKEFIDPVSRPNPDTPEKVIGFRAELESVLPGAYHFQNTRTKHIDALMRKAIDDGFKQIVLLGAGYDSRAYRFGNMASGIHFFEVDMPELQEEKKQKIIEIFGSLPNNVSYIPLDFNTQKLEDIINAPAYDPSKPTFFNWEGVSYYLTEAGINATLAFVSNNAVKGSQLVFDFMPRSMVDGSGEFFGGPESRTHMAKMGEPLLSGIEDGTIDTFLSERGFDIQSLFGPEELEQSYLIQSDGECNGRVSGYVRIVNAEVV